jgi:DNA-binding beta-propeller fold protein YncE
MALAITPNGQDAVVTLQGTSSHPGHQAVVVDLATRAVSAPINVGTHPESVAIAPNGNTAYVAALSSAKVTPIDLESSPPQAEKPIALPPGTSPRAIAVSPNGKTAYVLDSAGATIIPISLAHNKVGTPVDLVCRMQGDPGCTPDAIAIAGDGRTAYVAAAGSADVIMLALPSLTVAGVLETGGYPDALGLGSGWLFVADGSSNATTIFSGLRAPRTVPGGMYPFGVAVVAKA